MLIGRNGLGIGGGALRQPKPMGELARVALRRGQREESGGSWSWLVAFVAGGRAGRRGKRKGRELNAHRSKALEKPVTNERQATPDLGVNSARLVIKAFQILERPQPKLRKIQLLVFRCLVSDSFRSLLPSKPRFRVVGNRTL